MQIKLYLGNTNKIISSLGTQRTTDPRMENIKFLGPHQNTINYQIKTLTSEEFED